MIMRASVAFLTVFICILSLTSAVVGQVSVSELTHEWTVELGGSYSGEIEVINSGESPITVEVIQCDYTFFADSGSKWPASGELPRSNADWIVFDYASSYLTISAKSSIQLPYTITVPDDPNLVGTYWSVVKVRFSAGLSATSQEGTSIHQVAAYVIQIITHIGDTGERKVYILDAKLLYEGEGAILKIDLENTGERWVRPEAWAELYDENGAVVGRFESPRQRIYPGCSVRHRFPLVGILGGKYKALVIFDNGDEYVWGAQYDLEL